MSMSEPLMPNTSEHDRSPAAAEPGPGAPGTPSPEEPDILPDAPSQSDEDGDEDGDVELGNPPFRTPEPGDRLTAEDLNDQE